MLSRWSHVRDLAGNGVPLCSLHTSTLCHRGHWQDEWGENLHPWKLKPTLRPWPTGTQLGIQVYLGVDGRWVGGYPWFSVQTILHMLYIVLKIEKKTDPLFSKSHKCILYITYINVKWRNTLSESGVNVWMWTLQSSVQINTKNPKLSVKPMKDIMNSNP